MPSKIRSRVLCVDDDQDACEMLSVLLNAYEIDASCAPSAAEAWLKIKAERFDLYLLDAWLPGLDGFEFCRQIRETDSNTPIVFYSGAAYDADKLKGIAAGANAYVTKPNVEGLVKTMLDLMATANAKAHDVVVARWFVNPIRPAKKSFSARFLSVETVLD